VSSAPSCGRSRRGGCWRAGRSAWRPIRAIALAYLVASALLLLGGQCYDAVGLLLVLYAIGARVAEQWVARGGSGAAAQRTQWPQFRYVGLSTFC